VKLASFHANGKEGFGLHVDGWLVDLATVDAGLPHLQRLALISLFGSIVVATTGQAQVAPVATSPTAAADPGPTPPYGMPITLGQAEKVINAAKAEAARLKSGGTAVAVVDTHGELVAFERMDEATFHSVEYAQDKARGAARLRRTTATPPAGERDE
jgi:glc operon protein GlcG